MPSPDLHSLATPLAELPGVGPERAAQLARLELRSVGDLLLHRPRRYEDRRHVRTIRELEAGVAATTRGRIVTQGIKTFRRGAGSVFEFVLEDGTGRLHCRWWNLPFMERYFAVGNEVMVYGKVKSLKPRTIDHPETEIIETGEELFIHIDRIAPIYPLTEGLPQRWLRGLVWRALQRFAGQVEEPWPQLELTGHLMRADAIRKLHFPDSLEDPVRARDRLALDEFIELQLAIQRRRRHLQEHAAGLPCRGNNQLIKPFLHGIGFGLTAAQTRVLRELRQDMGGPFPMRRLVQGDVGSGKTVVAACCALMAIESGFNVALMAPTEILAEQHYQTFQRWFKPLQVAVELQTGSRKTLKGPHPAAATASPTLFIGTHALIEPAFAPPHLGLVVVDEQHKFGVAQREKLLRKGSYPHLLVMTATPIPRTLGLTIYGDLDNSVIDELPAGRGRVRTFVRGATELPKVCEFIREKIEAGRQAYIVFPRVEESDEAAGIKAVTRELDRIRKLFAPSRVGLLHGRLPPEEKDRVMAAFRANEIQILLATSVIEVGVDVPNATVMLIESADQFGLAQLHQLRGRIGRGSHESYCILATERATEEAKRRLQVLASTSDGFAIAEADLKLRGPGDLLGQNQSGLPPLRFGDLLKDRVLIEQARDLAGKLLDLTQGKAAAPRGPGS